MGDKSQYESLPIPTYEEAISSRPSSSRIGPEETSDDAERQGLLYHDTNGERLQPTQGYSPAVAGSERSSLDLLSSSSAEGSIRGSTEQLRRELEQMDVEEPPSSSSPRSSFSKRFTHFRRTLSSIHLPLRRFIPRFNVNFNLSGCGGGMERQQKCIVILRIFAVLIVASIVYILFVSDIFNFGGRLNLSQIYDPESVRMFVQNHVNESNIARNLEITTNFPHIAGTEGNYVLAKWMEEMFQSAGLEKVELERFDVYLNYPRKDGRRVAIVDPPEKAWEAKIDEDQVYSDPHREQTLVFHGLSKSGNVTGPLVYANYGSREDFKHLSDMGIKVEGSIALVRYYGKQEDRALKVKAAELAGAVGCIIYSDPVDDGFRKGDPWPKGRYMPNDGVQRGSVGLTSWVVGDVLSPGYPSLPGEKKRLSPQDSPGLNKIPSIPIAWRDAQHLLQSLKGHGKAVPKDWIGGVPDINEWWTGDPGAPKVNLANIQDEEKRQPIYNVIGRIAGVEQAEKRIIIGNHRDAWCFGAADPGSGTAILLELVRIFGELKSLGWRPLRTIEFVSWDGEEYNLIGSTEHVENRWDFLKRNGFAYLNVDVAVSGNKFQASGTPLFKSLLLKTLKRIADPKTGENLRSIWIRSGSQLEGLGAGSDYVAFQDIAGVPSIDLSFTGDKYPYHSCHDNYDWMKKAGDPGFLHHKALGQIWALLTLELADRPIVPYDMIVYSDTVSRYVLDLHDYAKSQSVPLKPLDHQKKHRHRAPAQDAVDFQPLYDAAARFRAEAIVFHDWVKDWNSSLYGSNGFETNVMAIKRMSHNSRMAYFDTHLLDLEEGGGVSLSPSISSC
ncbi:hypothetical protein FQN57_007300 [Myotisia sp. PD_48]|nr:hypothetical protein FQN57_007300 [Myotisia sp. PD_48]